MSADAGRLVVLDDPAAVAAAAADAFAAAAVRAVRARGRFAVALAGGTTPRAAYARLADPAAGLRDRVPWERVLVFLGDERGVPPDHPDSNLRMAREVLLDRVPVPPAQVFPFDGGHPDPDAAARAVEASLRSALGPAGGGMPRLDLALLGMGADGHTASLFPGSPALAETARLAVATRTGPGGTCRLTLTLPVLRAAAEVVFLVTGAAKAPALRAARGGAGADLPPAGLVRPVDGTLTWLVDRDAAA